MTNGPYAFRNLAARIPFLGFLAHMSTLLIPDLHWQIRRGTKSFRSVLDVGCGGITSPFSLIGKTVNQKRTGMDGFEPSIEAGRAAGIHDEYILGDIRDVDQAEQKFDCVIAIDVIEHFEKSESLRLLQKMEAVALRRVIAITPNGFLPQEPFDGNEMQRHLCGWSVGELRSLGYKVYGGSGLKSLRGEYGRPVLNPPIFGLATAMLSQFVAYWFPSIAFHLVAVKDLKLQEG